MQPIQINVQVNVGLNDNVVTLLSALLNKGTAPATEAAPKPRKPAAKPQAVEQPKPAEQEQPKPEAETAAQSTEKPVEQAAEKPEEQPAPTSVAPADKEYTEVDVRAAMDRTRKRIEGGDYKENTDSELYKKWHRRLTGWFKQTSAIFGAEKPSALTDSESRYKFIACCDALNVEGDEFSENLPF